MFNISEMTKSWLTLGLTSRWSVKLDHKLIESTKDGDLVLALDADAGLRKMLQTKTNKQKTTANKLEKSHMITYGCFLFIFPAGLLCLPLSLWICLGRGHAWVQ